MGEEIVFNKSLGCCCCYSSPVLYRSAMSSATKNFNHAAICESSFTFFFCFKEIKSDVIYRACAEHSEGLRLLQRERENDIDNDVVVG